MHYCVDTTSRMGVWLMGFADAMIGEMTAWIESGCLVAVVGMHSWEMVGCERIRGEDAFAPSVHYMDRTIIIDHQTLDDARLHGLDATEHTFVPHKLQ